jgi:HSP20 family protein
MERAPEKAAVAPARRAASPFDFTRFFDHEMERMFNDWGLGRWYSWNYVPREATFWSPKMEIEERAGKLFVRAELPGLKKNDVQVQITDEALVIEGERKLEENKEEGGYYRSERSYGRFYRTFALPAGIDTRTAKASFTDGVLQVTFDLPVEPELEARKLDIV